MKVRITDHLFRIYNGSGAGLRRGMCGYHGSCNRPAAEHIAGSAFRSGGRTKRPAS
jgi:hypothetical protein